MMRKKESEGQKKIQQQALRSEIVEHTELSNEEQAARRKAERRMKPKDEHHSLCNRNVNGLHRELKNKAGERQAAEKEMDMNMAAQKLVYGFSLKLLSLTKLDDVFQYAGQKIFENVPDSYVFVTAYNHNSKTFIFKYIDGISKFRKRISRLFGFDPFTNETITSNYSSDEMKDLKKMKFFETRDNIIHFLLAHFPDRGTCDKMETMLRVKKICTMGFSFGDELFGGIHILIKHDHPILNIGILENLVNQTSVVLQRLVVEEELHMNAKLYRSLFDTSPDGILMSDLKGFPMASNKNNFKIFGYAEEDINYIDTNIVDFIAPGDRERMRSNFLKRIMGESMQNQKYVALHKDGSEFPIEVNSSVIKNEYDEPYAVISIIRDITDRIKAEKALSESEKKYQFIVENTDDILWIMDGKFKMEYVSPSIVKFLGYTVEEHMCQKPEDYLTPESAKMIRDEFRQGMIQLHKKNYNNLRDKVEMEIEYIRKDNTKGFGRISMFIVRDEQFIIKKIRGITTDITVKKLAEIYGELSREVLQILNEQIGFREAIQRILRTMHSRLRFDAAGICLQEGDDNLFYEQIGFSGNLFPAKKFPFKDDAKGPKHKKNIDNKFSGCYCDLVLHGKTLHGDKSCLFNGSFWTNDAELYTDLPAEGDSSCYNRKTCFHRGYASVALVPVRMNDKTVGMIHLYDKRKGRFTNEVIQYLEGIAMHIGTSVMRKQTETALKDSEEKYRLLAQNMVDALSVIDRSGKILYVNDSACDHLGYVPGKVIGRKISHFIVDEDIHRIREIIRDMLLKKSPSRGFMCRIKKKNKEIIWLDTKLLFIRDEKGKINSVQCVSRDITEKIEAEARLEKERRKVMSALIDGQELERQRLSMELHDGLGQRLAGIKIKLENSTKCELEETRRTINEVKTEFREVIEEIRSMSMNVSPTILSNIGLTASLSMLCKQFVENNKIEFDYSVLGDFDHISEKKAFYIYRIVQEGLNNIAKHSNASLAKLALIEKEENVLILIEDNGIGFNRGNSDTSKGSGLSNMRQRTLLLNGELNIESGMNSGTVIMIKIPK
ncbi:MAG TPA: PAS domain S-box protein [Bacteroidales bacterium]|nr:PAS domain S-box protein [Bacteroidales bacterium]